MGLKTRIEKIESKFGKQAIFPPESIIPYLKEEKVAQTEAEIQWYNETLDNWLESARNAIERGDATFQEFFDSHPEPFKTKVCEAIRRQLKEGQKNGNDTNPSTPGRG